MNWDDLQFFIKLVEKGTLSATAEALEVQHTTVARRIDSLEKYLKLRLFNRVGKRYTITPEGSALYHQALDVQKQVAAFERIAYETDSVQGEVTISAPPVIAQHFLCNNLAKFYTNYPNISIRLLGEHDTVNLNQQQATVALRLFRPSQPNLVIRHIADLDYNFFAHQNYLKSLTPQQYRLVKYDKKGILESWLQSFYQGNLPSISFKSNDFQLIRKAISQQVGIGILPSFMANDHADLLAIDPITGLSPNKMQGLTANNDGILHHFSQPFFQLPVYLVIHLDSKHSAKIRAVMDWIYVCFEENSSAHI